MIPRAEHPRPDFFRESWLNLNGEWEFEIDNGLSGLERGLNENPLSGSITVPFCPESSLSGVGNTDFMNSVWYRRDIEIPDSWTGKRVLLNIGAADYLCEAFVNGTSVGKHSGGYVPIKLDITKYLLQGTNSLAIWVKDDTRSGKQPTGKQCHDYHSRRCDYTRTTGIWQTVYLEAVPENYIESVRFMPNAEAGELAFEVRLHGSGDLSVSALFKGEHCGEWTASAGSIAYGSIKLSKVELWDLGKPNLYDVELSFSKSGCADIVNSYCGLRSIALKDGAFHLNGRPVFQRLVLDQGFYPDGIYTAPDDAALKRDIELSMAMGFNGARLHQKVFEPRFLYWADMLGYMVWGEHASWGLDVGGEDALLHFLPEWLEVLERDFNHPCIVGWCPLNETWMAFNRYQNNDVVRAIYKATKHFDPSRPVIDASGYTHVETDIFDSHYYEQNPKYFAAAFEAFKEGGKPFVNVPDRQSFGGEPYAVSEYGGIWWAPNASDESWGYGSAASYPKTPEEFIERYRGLTECLLNHPRICMFCYTQLTDVEQEVNGLYTYNREPKFDAKLIRSINDQIAAIEK